ncbi:MCD1 [Candida margitis]|uniref:MCD1 n=1 Tax=Candida margitis TaxID=1775924 RepID=UPI002227B92D|nr:MCD1 [Candida margitis]KAI5963946.1 MCD1 [Candida margitis]
MLNTSLISNDGPLGDIWLAANYDKKLTKHQLLNTDIVESAKYISNRTSASHDPDSPTEMDAITLRLSGQLLLGVTKIYSRKTKYLLDDINDVLYKLRAVFRMSSGVQLGPDGLSAKVNLPPQHTTISDLNTITLKDQVTGFDLLWQENLQLEEEPINPLDTVFNNENDASRFDTSVGSIEYGRLENVEDNAADKDEDINLDFDLNLDDGRESFAGSIELGRNVSNVGDDEHNSILGDLHKSNNIFELDLGQPLQNIDDFDFEFDDGYVSSSSLANNEVSPVENQQTSIQPRARSRPRQKRTRITDDGEMVVVNKKLVVDSEDNLQISLDSLRDNQQNTLIHVNSKQLTGSKMSNSDKLLLIQELSLPVASKKRKLWDFSSDLHFRIPVEQDDSDDEGGNNSSTDDSDDSIDNSMDDITMSDSESEKETPSKSRKVDGEDDNEDDNEEEEDSADESFGENGVENVAKSTKQAADELQDLFRLDASVSFKDFVEADSTAIRPLGLKNKKYVNSKREASRCFFEVLVLATNDCINLHQESSDLSVPTSISITSRDNLFNYV